VALVIDSGIVRPITDDDNMGLISQVVYLVMFYLAFVYLSVCLLVTSP